MTALSSMKWLGVVALVLGNVVSLLVLHRSPTTLAPFDEYCRRLDRAAGFLRLPRAGHAVGLTQLAGGLSLLGMARAWMSPWPLVWLAAVLAAPALALSRARRARVEQIEAQLDGWLITLASSLRATPSLGEALSASVSTTPRPLAEEVDLLLKEHRLGAPLDRALDDMARRIDSRSLTAMVLTLQVARASGGGISEALERSASALREMLRLDGVVRTKTAEGKAQAFVVCAVPFPFFGALHAIDAGLLAPLTATPSGHLVLAAASAIWLAAVVLARRIVQVDL